MLSALYGKLTGYAVAIAAALAILAGIYRKGGTDAAQRTTAQRLDELNKARKVEDEVHSLDRAGLDERLARWLRDN